MPIAIEISKDQQYLLWRPHLLTELMESKRLHGLTLEPVINPSEAAHATIKIEINDVSLTWEWGNWKRVDITGEHVGQAGIARSYLRSQPAQAEWADLQQTGDVEVVFHGANGLLARAKIEVPEVASFGQDVTFARLAPNIVRVQVTQEAAVSQVVAYWLRLGQMDEYKQKGAPFPFPASALRMDVPVPDSFFGILAVVANRNNHRELIAAADYFNEDRDPVPQRPGDNEFQKVRRWFEGNHAARTRRDYKQLTTQEWLRSWPNESQLRLRSIYDHAQQYFHSKAISVSDEVLRSYPTGALRYLTLIECGFERSDPPTLIRQLNNHSFQTALNSALPRLGAALEVLNPLAEKSWAIQHAGDRNLPEAVREAANLGVRALARALHLADKRSQAIACWEARREMSSV